MSLTVETDAGCAGSYQVPQYQAQDLTQGGQLARIRLDDQMYILRITRAGKLILTK
ncbi:hemin uptake protein HemP [Antarctobacter jejuensis]|uniref:hemin uptake protein HemP n=1 Tax=Antarctobacter jejuensis TaxID=1439938 RepID=UPI003FD35895